MTDTRAPSEFRLTGWHVLAIVVGFFAIVIGLDTWFTVLAVRSFPGQVSVTPYEDGLLYNRKIAQLQTQERLGWRAAAAGQPGAVMIELRDRANQPLRGLSISGKLERPATEAGRLTLAFREEQPGVYVSRHAGLTGAWDLTAVALDKAGRRFEAERRLSWP